MDAQWLMNALFGSCGALGGFVIKAIWDALRNVQREMTNLQESVLENYVRRDDFAAHALRIESVLVRIEDKLDGKADK